MRAQLNHLGIYTARSEVMERFYVGVVGLVVTDRGKVPRLGDVAIVFMSANPASHHQLALIERSGDFPSCINQIAFKVDTLSQLRAFHARLMDEGVTDIQLIDHGNAWSLYTADPDGNGVEVYLDTPWHVAQPHSEALDLARSDAEIVRATEARVRADPTFAPMSEWRSNFAQALQ